MDIEDLKKVSPIKELKAILKHTHELNKLLEKFDDEDIQRLFGLQAEEIKEAKEYFIYSEEVLKNMVEHNHGK